MGAYPTSLPTAKGNGRPDGTNPTLSQPISPDGTPEPFRRYVVPARHGRAVRLAAGQRLAVHNPNGTQVCDFWAFDAADPFEYLSFEHARAALGRLVPKVGDDLLTNRRRPILTLEEDTSPGVHDTLIAACDLHRYRMLGVADYHDNCSDNLRMALLAIGIEPREVPQPFNLWMNIPVAPDMSFSWGSPVSRPGDRVVFRARRDTVAVMSSCPQDLVPVNGADMRPSELAFEIFPAD